MWHHFSKPTGEAQFEKRTILPQILIPSSILSVLEDLLLMQMKALSYCFRVQKPRPEMSYRLSMPYSCMLPVQILWAMKENGTEIRGKPTLERWSLLSFEAVFSRWNSILFSVLESLQLTTRKPSTLDWEINYRTKFVTFIPSSTIMHLNSK